MRIVDYFFVKVDNFTVNRTINCGSYFLAFDCANLFHLLGQRSYFFGFNEANVSELFYGVLGNSNFGMKVVGQMNPLVFFGVAFNIAEVM